MTPMHGLLWCLYHLHGASLDSFEELLLTPTFSTHALPPTYPPLLCYAKIGLHLQKSSKMVQNQARDKFVGIPY